MLRRWILLLAAPVLAGACNDQPPLLAPDTAVLEGVSLHLSVNLSRGLSDALVVRLAAPDSIVIPSSVVADSVLVVNGSETWAAALTEALPRFPGYAVFFVNEGPSWPVGSIVDVFVTVRDGPRRRLLEAPRQQITIVW
jgi:hypothetical protein